MNPEPATSIHTTRSSAALGQELIVNVIVGIVFVIVFVGFSLLLILALSNIWVICCRPFPALHAALHPMMKGWLPSGGMLKAMRLKPWMLCVNIVPARTRLLLCW